MTYQIFRKDAFVFLASTPDDSVDLVFTDYPYESLEKHRKVGTTTRLSHSKSSSNDWFGTVPNARLPEMLAHFYRILRKNSHCYMMCDQETMFAIKPAAEAVGFKWWKAVVWSKAPRIGMGYHYRCMHEMVVFLEKGKKQLNDLGMPDVLQATPVRNGYPAEKPVDLVEKFVSQSTQPGEIVVDPFMGSGSTGVAAIRLGRRFIGNDTSAKAILLASERLELAERIAQNAAVTT